MTTRRRKANRLVLAALLGVLLLLAVWLAFRGGGNAVSTPGPTSPAGSAATTGSAPSTRPTSEATVPTARPGIPSEVGSGATQSVRPVKTNKPVNLDDPADFGTGLTVRLSDIEAMSATAERPGEIAGPALKVTLVVRNRSAKTIGVDRVVVFMSYGKSRTPASQLTEGSKPLTRSVPADESRTGSYVFGVPEDQRDLVRVEVSYSGRAPTVAFEGPVEP